jgi:hypothetical protein
LLEVDADESLIEEARKILPQVAVPRARELGAKSGYWLAAQGGRGVNIALFDSEEDAKKAASQFTIGQPPMPNAPMNVTVRSVEVREVIASF